VETTATAATSERGCRCAVPAGAQGDGIAGLTGHVPDTGHPTRDLRRAAAAGAGTDSVQPRAASRATVAAAGDPGNGRRASAATGHHEPVAERVRRPADVRGTTPSCARGRAAGRATATAVEPSRAPGPTALTPDPDLEDLTGRHGERRELGTTSESACRRHAAATLRATHVDGDRADAGRDGEGLHPAVRSREVERVGGRRGHPRERPPHDDDEEDNEDGAEHAGDAREDGCAGPVPAHARVSHNGRTCD
jgi:hypothetical protein